MYHLRYKKNKEILKMSGSRLTILTLLQNSQKKVGDEKKGVADLLSPYSPSSDSSFEEQCRQKRDELNNARLEAAAALARLSAIGIFSHIENPEMNMEQEIEENSDITLKEMADDTCAFGQGSFTAQALRRKRR